MTRTALLGAFLLAGCMAPEQGTAKAPAAGLTLNTGAHSTVYVFVSGDGNLKGTAAPETTSSGTQDTTGHALTVPVSPR